eukprot:XP_011665068.1 PREDICTED: oral-facial-digital syndrome 1 protein [Strongylocentrotus purpuratus]
MLCPFTLILSFSPHHFSWRRCRRIAELGSEYKGEQTRHEELIKQLSERMSRPSPELQALRSELQQTREQLSHEKATIQHMEAQWNARLQDEIESNKDLRHRLSEQTNEMASLMRQLADLKLALRQTQTALNNNIYHADRNLGLAVDDTLHNSNLGNDIYMDTSLHRNTLGPELLLADSSRYQLPLDDSNSGEDSESQGGDSIAFIEQTKARFRQLEREAEHLEHNYQDLQHRMSGAGGSYQSPGPESLYSSTRPPSDMRMSRIPDQSSHLPLDGSRQALRESTHSHSSPHSKHPKKHSGPHKSKARKERSADDRTRLAESSGSKQVGGPALDHTDRRMSEKRTRSSSSSSSSSSISLKLNTSDLGGPDRKDDAMWMSPGTTAGAIGEGNLSHLSDHSVPQALSDDEQKRATAEERRRKEEEERKKMETERIRREEEDRRHEEEERRREETGREEEEQRAWEEKRRKKEEERKRKEQEAREREQKMLMELQKQESGASGGVPEPKQDHSAGLNDTYELGDDGKKDEQEEKKEEEDGVKIDPVMQRYMMMVQQRKQQQDATPATQEPEVIPDSPPISHKSDGTISGEEMEGGVEEDPASAGKASDNDDPFGDW